MNVVEKIKEQQATEELEKLVEEYFDQPGVTFRYQPNRKVQLIRNGKIIREQK